jgi:protein-disulfide isomerase
MGVIIVALLSMLVAIAWSRIAAAGQSSAPVSAIRAVGSNDHIEGDVGAPVKLIVYTDLECEYCKRFHDVTRPLLFSEYGDTIAIVYRHFPMPSRPKALVEAEAAECAYVLGGHDAFWAFVDEVYVSTPSNNGLDLSTLVEMADRIGLDRAEFQQCRDTGRTTRQVQLDLLDGLYAGVALTPSILVQSDERSILVAGDYPARIQTAIEYVRAVAAEPKK